MRRLGFRFLVAGLVAGVSLLAGCDDPKTPLRPEAGPSPYADLTEQWHPLENVKLALVRREVGPYRSALDAAYYSFVFAPGDVAAGLDSLWTFSEDAASAKRLLDRRLPDLANRAVTIEFNLLYDKDPAAWGTVASTHPAGETWHTITASYVFLISFGDGRAFTQVPGAQADIVVREDPSDGKWRIVQIRDILPAAPANASTGDPKPESVDEASIGWIKNACRE